MSNVVKEIEVDLEDAKAAVAKSEALERLHQNKDFKEVVLQGYFRDHAADLTSLLAHPAMTQQRELILRSIEAVGETQQYFSTVFQQGAMQAEAISQHETALSELAEEGEL